MPLMLALTWLPLLLLSVWAVRTLLGSRRAATGSQASAVAPEPNAREIARRAYARGDMTRERFIEVIEDLDRTEGPVR